MSEEGSNILYGPKPRCFVKDGTAGQQLYEALLKYRKEPNALVNAVTGDAVSYEQMLNTTCKLAECLKNFGLEQNDVISVCSENNLYFLYPVIAALYLGVIAAPLNQNYSKRELCNALEISKPQLIFCSKQSLNKIMDIKNSYPFIKKIVILDSLEDVDDAQCFSNFILIYTIEDILEEANYKLPDFDRNDQVALIMCSSGTTGLPKGAMLTHKNLVTRFSHCHDADTSVGIDITPGHTVLTFMPFFHAGGLVTMLGYLIKGFQVVLLQRFNQEHFLKAIQDYKVEVIILVPTILVFLAKSPLVDKYDLSTLKDIGVSTAPLSKDIQDLVMKRLSIKPIRQGYGLTEGTLALTVMPENEFKIGSAGKLVPSMSAKVIDPDTHEILKRNQPGELCFKGDLIMKGYAENEEATKNAFDEDGWLKTGDLGYFDDDGHLYIVGRLKELIKYKSYQVPPAELEEILLEHSSIKDAAVVGLPDEEAGELPVAFVVLQPDKQLTEKEVQEYVAEKVSAAKRLRGGVRFVEEIPKNSTGKIQRMILRDLLKK